MSFTMTPKESRNQLNVLNNKTIKASGIISSINNHNNKEAVVTITSLVINDSIEIHHITAIIPKYLLKNIPKFSAVSFTADVYSYMHKNNNITALYKTYSLTNIRKIKKQSTLKSKKLTYYQDYECKSNNINKNKVKNLPNNGSREKMISVEKRRKNTNNQKSIDKLIKNLKNKESR